MRNGVRSSARHAEIPCSAIPHNKLSTVRSERRLPETEISFIQISPCILYILIFANKERFYLYVKRCVRTNAPKVLRSFFKRACRRGKSWGFLTPYKITVNQIKKLVYTELVVIIIRLTAVLPPYPLTRFSLTHKAQRKAHKRNADLKISLVATSDKGYAPLTCATYRWGLPRKQ